MIWNFTEIEIIYAGNIKFFIFPIMHSQASNPNIRFSWLCISSSLFPYRTQVNLKTIHIWMIGSLDCPSNWVGKMRRLKNLPSCSSMYYIWLVVGGEDSGLCSCLSQVVGRQDLCDMMKKIVFISIFASSIAGTRRSSGWTTGDCDNYMSGISGGPLHQCNVQIRQMQSMPI